MALVINEVNTERFIDEVKLRPCLWNCVSEEYKDREIKKTKWTELCILFYPNFEKSTPSEKSDICKLLQGKWKNIRDSYRKYLKSVETKSGKARKDVKTYLYAAQLSFLKSSLQLGPTESSPNIEQRKTIDQNIDLDASDNTEELPCPSTLYKRKKDMDISENTEEKPCSSTVYRRQKKTLESKLEKYLDKYNASHQGVTQDADCDDLNFFKSLLPMVKPLPISDKIKLRIEFMKLAHEFSLKHQQTVAKTTKSSPIIPQLFVDTALGGSGTKRRKGASKKRRGESPSELGVLQLALKRLREDKDSSESDSPGGNSVGSGVESDNYFSEGGLV